VTAPSLILVLGGARSGKSRFALERSAALPAPRLFVATAEAGDDEMAERIARHRRERGEEWRTREEPLRIAPVVGEADGGVVLVDCLTIWLANVLEAGLDPETEVTALVDALAARRAAVVAVSNEVGLGIVPANALARAFRDAAGRMNQRVAAIADEVWFLVAGRALRMG
jgi:adenosylcobinamide kinase/adenosylcobinamide-phosphate guanylyltransferase